MTETTPATESANTQLSIGFSMSEERAVAPSPFLELSGVSKSFGEGAARSEVLSEIDLSVREGEFLAIVGFSGSGKTTLINLIAGLVEADEGTIELDGKPITGPGPDRGVVFQSYALLPWLTVMENVQLAVDSVFRDASKADRAARARSYVEMVGLGAAHWKYPRELSGGMRQRVIVARGLAMDPKILLLDEPLSALDALTRATLQTEIEQIWAADKKTVVLITNDVDEAILLADRIIPLRPGPRASLGPIFDVPLERPRDRTAVNDDPHFRKIRNEITHYLMAVSRQAARISSRSRVRKPDVKPLDLRPRSLPSAR